MEIHLIEIVQGAITLILFVVLGLYHKYVTVPFQDRIITQQKECMENAEARERSRDKEHKSHENTLEDKVDALKTRVDTLDSSVDKSLAELFESRNKTDQAVARIETHFQWIRDYLLNGNSGKAPKNTGE